MALTEERKRELDAAMAAGAPASEPPAPPELLEAPEARLTRLNKMAEERGEPPLTLAAVQTAQNVGKEASKGPAPSFGKQAWHAAKGAPAGLVFEPLNMIPSAVNAASSAIEQGIPKAVGAVYNFFADEPIDVQVEGEGARLPTTQDVPGVRQAEDLLASREFEEGVAPGADALRKGAEWGSAIGPNLFRKSLGSLTQRIAPDLVQGAGAASGSYLGDVYADSPIIGEMIGGVTAALAGKPFTTNAFNSAEGKAARFAKATMEDADQAIANTQEALARGEKGTVGDLSRDRGALGVERATYQDPQTRWQYDDKAAERQQQIADELRLPTDGTPKANAQAAAGAEMEAQKAAIENARLAEEGALTAQSTTDLARLNATRQQAAAAEKAATDQATAATQAAKQAGLPLATGQRPAQTAKAAQEAVSEWDKAYEAAEATPAWNEFKAGPDVNVRPMYQDVNAALKTLRDENPREYAALVKRYGGLLDEANAWKKGGAAAPADISGYLSDVRKAIEASRAGSPSGRGDNVDNVMKKLRDGMEESIASDVNPLYRDAVAKTRELYQRFRSGPLGDARSAEPELFMRSAGGAADESGAVLARQVRDAAGGDPAKLEVLADQMKAMAQREGGVTDDFINKYADALEGLPPETKQQFMDLAAANRTKESALKQATEAAKANKATQTAANSEERLLNRALEASQLKTNSKAAGLQATRMKTVLAEYAADADATLNKLLKNEGLSNVQKADDLKVLTKYMDEAGQGDAFRVAVSDRLQALLAKATDGSVAIKPKAIGDFEKMRATLINSDILDRKKAADMSEALNRTKTIKERSQAVSREMTRQGNEWDNLVASGLAALSLSAMPGTQTLLVGGAVRRMIRKYLQGNKKPAEVEALERLMLNPEEFLAAAKNAKTAEEAASMILTEVVGAGQVADILAGEDE